MAIYIGYQPATGSAGRATPGAKALMSWYLGAYAGRSDPRPANLGIFVPKRLGSGWSLHAEGRAADLGTAPYTRPPWGWTLANALRTHSAELGVQAVIFDGRIWSGAYPHAGWRTYSGADPHRGHLHVELTRRAGDILTPPIIEAVLGGKPSPSSPASWQQELIRRMNTVDLSRVTTSPDTWVRNSDVRRLQGLLLADGHGPAGLVGDSGRPDGIAGPGTRRVLGDAQRKHHTGRPGDPDSPDFIAAAGTWSALAGVVL